MELDIVANKKINIDIDIDIDINMEIQFGERVGHGGWLFGPKLFRSKLTRYAHLLCFLSLFRTMFTFCIEWVQYQ